MMKRMARSIKSAASALERSYDKLKKLSERGLKHPERRGHFPQEAAGESMGGGQKVNYSLLCYEFIQVPGTLQSTSQIIFMALTWFIRVRASYSHRFHAH